METEQIISWLRDHAKEADPTWRRVMLAAAKQLDESDGCEYCKEDGDGYRKMFGAFSITNPFHGNEWFINTGHCKMRRINFCPMCGRKLPQPPKGE